jgi:hypothetical protein
MTATTAYLNASVPLRAAEKLRDWLDTHTVMDLQ